MSTSIFTAAKRICERSGWTVTNLKLQKLLYIAHLLHIGREGVENPLIDGYFEAWDYGPVNNDLYHKLKAFGSKPVRDIFRGYDSLEEHAKECQVLDEVWDKLGSKQPFKLVQMTHNPKGAWVKSYPSGVITNDAILAEYNELTK